MDIMLLGSRLIDRLVGTVSLEGDEPDTVGSLQAKVDALTRRVTEVTAERDAILLDKNFYYELYHAEVRRKKP